MFEEEMKKQQAWDKMVDCKKSNNGLCGCGCGGKCINAYFTSLAMEDQEAIKIARNPNTREQWIERAGAFHNKPKNGKAERRLRAFEAANQK